MRVLCRNLEGNFTFVLNPNEFCDRSMFQKLFQTYRRAGKHRLESATSDTTPARGTKLRAVSHRSATSCAVPQRSVTPGAMSHGIVTSNAVPQESSTSCAVPQGIVTSCTAPQGSVMSGAMSQGSVTSGAVPHESVTSPPLLQLFLPLSNPRKRRHDGTFSDDAPPTSKLKLEEASYSWQSFQQHTQRLNFSVVNNSCHQTQAAEAPTQPTLTSQDSNDSLVMQQPPKPMAVQYLSGAARQPAVPFLPATPLLLTAPSSRTATPLLLTAPSSHGATPQFWLPLPPLRRMTPVADGDATAPSAVTAGQRQRNRTYIQLSPASNSCPPLKAANTASSTGATYDTTSTGATNDTISTGARNGTSPHWGS